MGRPASVRGGSCSSSRTSATPRGTMTRWQGQATGASRTTRSLNNLGPYRAEPDEPLTLLDSQDSTAPADPFGRDADGVVSTRPVPSLSPSRLCAFSAPSAPRTPLVGRGIGCSGSLAGCVGATFGYQQPLSAPFPASPSRRSVVQAWAQGLHEEHDAAENEQFEEYVTVGLADLSPSHRAELDAERDNGAEATIRELFEAVRPSKKASSAEDCLIIPEPRDQDEVVRVASPKLPVRHAGAPPQPYTTIAGGVGSGSFPMLPKVLLPIAADRGRSAVPRMERPASPQPSGVGQTPASPSTSPIASLEPAQLRDLRDFIEREEKRRLGVDALDSTPAST